MLKSWKVCNDFVILTYDEGELYVSRTDFNRAFGCIVSANYDSVKHDFHKPELKK